MSITWSAAIARRLDRHGLAEPAAHAELAAVAGVIGGVHAQVMSAAELSLAIRVQDATVADVRDAIVVEHTVIKTFGVRGTVHLLPAAELGHWMAAVEVGGRTAWVSAGDEEFGVMRRRSIRLLPYFDAYSVGSHPRDVVFPGRASERALAGGQAGNYPVLLVDGRTAGVWHQRNAGRRAHVTVEPLEPLSDRRTRALEQEVERVGAILGREAALTIGPVSVGPHA